MSAFEGRWTNTYHSTLSLQADGERLYGSYSSHTGSSGIYHVLGYGSSAAPASGRGIGAALCLLWRPYRGGTPDPSWHWVSGFAGQLLLDADGRPGLLLNHDLAAPVAFPETAGVGSYVDKLSYVPAGPAVPLPAPGQVRSASRPDPVDGDWACAAPALRLALRLRDEASGWLDGTLTVGPRSFPVTGFCDHAAAGTAPPRQGVCLAAATGDGSFQAYSGWLERDTGALVLLQQTSRGTPSAQTYLQTSAQGLRFERA